MAEMIILVSYMGFAGVGGVLLRFSKGKSPWIFVLFLVFILFPASIGLPLALPVKILSWAIALLMICLFAIRPGWIPVWTSGSLIFTCYFGIVSTLVFFWLLIRQDQPCWVYLGSAALLAAILNIRKAIQKIRDGRGAV